LGSFTHIWFFFLLFAQGLHLLIFVRRRVMLFGAAMGGSLAPYAALWLPDLLRQVRKTQEALAWMSAPTVEQVLNTFLLYTAPLLVVTPFLVAMAVSQRRRPPGLVWGLGFMLAAALAVPFAISFWKPVFYPRFTIIGLHLFALAVAACAPRVRIWQVPAVLAAMAGAIALYSATHQQCSSRWGAEFVARNAAPGDAVIFTSLSRLPVDHYLQGASAPKLTEASFPAEIDDHPGYEGSLRDPRRAAELDTRAAELVQKLRGRHASIFFFHGFRPEVDAILERHLNAEFRAVESRSVQCAGMGCYYNAVTVYQ
jgi:hypothetical protein